MAVGRLSRLAPVSPWLPVLSVFVLGAATRLAILFSDGHPLDALGYDQSVYYAAAAALVRGRFPYHGDVVFVHPPAIILAGTPFALLGRLAGDVTGFVAENTVFALVGALNAVLVVIVARAWSMRRGAVFAGVAYALWPVGTAAESSGRLEPLGNLVFLLLLWALGRGREGATRPLVLAGVVLAVLVNVKLWWCVPAFVAVVLTAVAGRKLRTAVVPAVVASVTALALDLPFLLVAGPRMLRSIVTAQLHRPADQWTSRGDFSKVSTQDRLAELTGARQAVTRVLGSATDADHAVVVVVTWVVLVVFAAAAVVACRHVGGRIFVAVVACQGVVLLAAPVYYPYYGGYVAVAVALVVAAAVAVAAGALRQARPRSRATGFRAGGWALAAGLAVVMTIGALGRQPGRVDWSALRRETAGVRCLVSDSPYVLIRLHALDRSLRPGCRNVIDYQGVEYGAGPDPRAKAWLRSSTPEYQQFLTRYLTSGDAVAQSLYYMRVRLGTEGARRVDEGPVLARSGDVVVRWTRHAPGG